MKVYRVLIVEDDRVIAKSVRQHMEAWGFSARTVRDFSDVMREFAEFDPHLVLMDIGLPFLGFRQHEYRHGDEYGRR